jgi:hypothetical protein
MKKFGGILVLLIGLAAAFAAWGEAGGFWERFESRDLFFDGDALPFTVGAVVFIILGIILIIRSRKSPDVLKDENN